MRLLNLYDLAFEEFYDDQIPSYAILSHRWGHHEVTHKDFLKKRTTDGPGYDKILDFCEFARKREGRVWDEVRMELRTVPIQWGWVDTCCIDKRSSAELSEAINSMFEWYSKAAVCYVYLADVPPYAEGGRTAVLKAFTVSDWFSRGWTLQELLAPWDVVFCTRDWEIIGHKCTHGDGGRPLPAICEEVYGSSLNSELGLTANIRPHYLHRPAAIFDASIACRMSWAANRKTTRIEDAAYSLLGIFEVNMPLLYGEGAKAFLRLQEEIVRTSNDQSIFAWSISQVGSGRHGHGMFAPAPFYFLRSWEIYSSTFGSEAPYALTNNGLEMRVKAQKVIGTPADEDVYVFPLDCYYAPFREEKSAAPTQYPVEVAVWRRNTIGSNQFLRVSLDTLDAATLRHELPKARRQEAVEMLIYIKHWSRR